MPAPAPARAALSARFAIPFLVLAACGGGSADDDGSELDAAAGEIDAPAGTDPVLRGVNLSSAEWGEGNLPGTYDTDYTYPTTAEIDYFAGQHMTVVRLAFRWERLQQTLDGELDATELGRLDAVVDYATTHGVAVILDPHNYARYGADVIGGPDVSNDDFGDFWARVAAHYAGDDGVLFGLINEPHDLPTEQWLAAANAAIAAIRGAGAHNRILVPGNAWTGGHSWLESYYGTSNAEVMPGVIDPEDRFAFEIHEYLDADYSGTSPLCQSETIGVETIAPVTTWAREHGVRLFLGELAGGDNATCEIAIDAMLDHLEANGDVWTGWTWWAAGPWWGDYLFTLEPDGGNDAAQMAWLTPHLP
jgi:endoglucanase